MSSQEHESHGLGPQDSEFFLVPRINFYICRLSATSWIAVLRANLFCLVIYGFLTRGVIRGEHLYRRNTALCAWL